MGLTVEMMRDVMEKNDTESRKEVVLVMPKLAMEMIAVDLGVPYSKRIATGGGVVYVERQKIPTRRTYIRPSIVKNKKMTFPTDIIAKVSGGQVCKQCSSCHGCR